MTRTSVEAVGECGDEKSVRVCGVDIYPSNDNINETTSPYGFEHAHMHTHLCSFTHIEIVTLLKSLSITCHKKDFLMKTCTQAWYNRLT